MPLLTSKAPLHSALGCALLRLQRVLLVIFAEHSYYIRRTVTAVTPIALTDVFKQKKRGELNFTVLSNYTANVFYERMAFCFLDYPAL